MTKRRFLISGLFFMLCAVALGAFGAHFIEARVSTQHMQTWNTAAEYQFYHSLGLIGLALWLENRTVSKLTRAAGSYLIVGIILFCGSLYTLVVTGNSQLGMITPIGGVAFIIGWLCWLIAVIRNN